MGEQWPKFNNKLVFSKEEKEFGIVQQLINTIRSIRSEKGIEPARKIHLIVYGGKWTKLLEAKREAIIRMARLDKLDISLKGSKIARALWKYFEGIDLYLPIQDLFDLKQERQNLLKKLDALNQKIIGLEAKLSNESFLRKAPVEIVQKEKQIFADLKKELEALQLKMAELDTLEK